MSERYVAVAGSARVQLGEQRNHADKAGNGEGANRGAGFFSNVDFCMDDVVEDRQGLDYKGVSARAGEEKKGVNIRTDRRYKNPAREKETRILRSPRQV